MASQNNASKPSAVAKATTPAINQEAVHIRIEEKVSLTAGRDGGLQNMEIHGMGTLRISDDQFGRVKVLVAKNDKKDLQLQVRCFILIFFHISKKKKEKNVGSIFSLHLRSL